MSVVKSWITTKGLGAMVVTGIALAMPVLLSGQASPPPFNPPARSYSMPCAYCHSVHNGTVVTRGTDAVEVLCMSCHNGTFTDPVTGRAAVQVEAHTTSRSDYGAYKISCLGCHSPHRNAKAVGSETVNPPDGYGNWMLIGDWAYEASTTDGLARLRRPRIIDVNGDNGGTGRTRYTDDVMEGYYCSNVADVDTAANAGAVRSGNVVTIKTVTIHGFSAGSTVRIGGVTNTSFNGAFTIATTPTTKTFTFAQTGANATSGGGTARTTTNNQPACVVDPPSATDLTRTVRFYDNRYPGSAAANQWAQPQVDPPTALGSQWYNGACNSCHTRTNHHRRDNSGGDHDHHVTQACHDCHRHDQGWIR